MPGAELEPIAIEPERELSAEERARLEAEEEERARREAEEAERRRARRPHRPPGRARQGTQYQATGKRKSSVARVIVRPGGGAFEVNERTLDEYFPREYLQVMVRQPLVTAGYEGKVDVRVRVHGGGISGQAGAVRHGIARALTEIDPELRRELKRRGMLTRDARGQGTPQGRPEEGPQAAAVLQALKPAPWPSASSSAPTASAASSARS